MRSRPTQRQALAAGGAIALALGVVVAIAVTRSDEGHGETIDVAGMEMTASEVVQMTRDSMGEDDLSDVELVTPDERIPELQARVERGVKVFTLEAQPLRWEYRDDQAVAAWGYQQQVPGPAIHVTEGEKVRVVFTNLLQEHTTVHWHGIDVPFEHDGVPGVTQEAIEPGATYTYEFTATPAGTRFYHTHGSSGRDEARQLDMGLSGALIVEPRDAKPTGVDDTLVLDEWAVEADGINSAMMSGAGHAAHNAGFNVFTINGRSSPDFEPIEVARGQTVRLRFINAGSSATHPMHLHGHQFTVTALDGNPVPVAARQLRNVIVLAPGETADVEFTADNPGVWMLHCHELHHADAGMMTLLQYDGYEPVGGHAASHDHDEADE